MRALGYGCERRAASLARTHVHTGVRARTLAVPFESLARTTLPVQRRFCFFSSFLIRYCVILRSRFPLFFDRWLFVVETQLADLRLSMEAL